MSSIPIIINNRNRLTTTRKLANDLWGLGYNNIHILDNESTYPPLLSWYKTCEFKVYSAGGNKGHNSIWNSGYIKEFKDHPWIAYTDSDIELGADTPVGFIERMIAISDKYRAKKVGLALKIDDLPDNKYTVHYKSWEKNHWIKELEKDIYEAPVDSSFCIINPLLPYDYVALRVGGDLTAIHTPWYLDLENLNEEEQYYIDHSEEVSTYKRFYHTMTGK